MSRSRKKNPFYRMADSSKVDKQIANRKLRRKVNSHILKNIDYDAEVLPIALEVSDNWSWSADGGKIYLSKKNLEENCFHDCNRLLRK